MTLEVGDIFKDADGVGWLVTPDRIQPVAAVPDESDRGPAGPPGESIVGPPGRDGIAGPAGIDGTGFRFRGKWKRSLAFEPNDVCTHEGQTWLAVKANSKSVPGVGKAFVLLAARGEDGIDGKDGANYFTKSIHRTETVYGTTAPLSVIFDTAANKGAVLYTSGAGRVDLAQANSDPQARAIGLALAGVAEGSPGEIVTGGAFTNEAWNWTPGAILFLDPAVPGGLTATCPTANGHFVIIIGSALSPTQINVEIHWALLLGT